MNISYKLHKRRSGPSILAGLCLTMIILSFPGTHVFAQDQYIYPLRMEPGKRYVVDQHGKPFFWSGEAAWSLIAQLNKKETELYLDNRKEKGVTILMVNLLEHKFSDHAPANYYKDQPFTGKPFRTPNEPYFTYADWVIREAGNRGMAVLLCPLYLGWKYGDEGWGGELKKASDEDLEYWGNYIGKRYKDYKNIVWCVGGDADPSLEREKVLSFVRGLKEADDGSHIFSAHCIPEEFAVTHWDGEKWLNVNNVYSYSKSLYQLCKTAYERKPVMPFYLIESAYENEHNSTPEQLRREAYWPVLSGGMGYVFGNCPIWHFSSDSSYCQWTPWQTQLDGPGSMSMMYLQRLMLSRPWFLLEPDFNHVVLVAGYGVWGSEDYVTAAKSSDGSTMIAYMPRAREVSVNLNKLKCDEVRCWWYNPASGEASEIGNFKAMGIRKFMPPSTGDRVLVIDDNSRNFPVPGR